ncbi:exocyst complex component 2 [Petromyzon marinus]|uniref:exocyst complex component 2 n=1 Tax=Petromyzon marinus TaxID=7757 RepID=UPI003F7071F1
MSRVRAPPQVTGISPKEGAPWTKVTIRGENLGTGLSDITGLTICGHSCLLTAEWLSAGKLTCRTGPAARGDGRGDIIVTTRSGGRGSSTVTFRVLTPQQIGVLEPCAVWVEESGVNLRLSRNKAASPLSLRPTNPLGVDIDREKTFPQECLTEMFPGKSGDFTSETFSPTWYLIENHSTTSFENLRVGVQNLRKQASKKDEGGLSCVKGGLSTFFEAQDALSAIHQRLEEEGTKTVEGCMTEELEYILQKASGCADTLFQEVLSRKDNADATRNALSVLQRFKFLFNLPLSIDRSVHKGDYDVVINDYEKAKSLFGSTEVRVFQKVYADVEVRIEGLRKLLLGKLLETPATLHDQKRYIRYLADLRSPGDPTWQCIVGQQKWLLSLMTSCHETWLKEETEEAASGGAPRYGPDAGADPGPALPPSAVAAVPPPPPAPAGIPAGWLGHGDSLRRTGSFRSGQTRTADHAPSRARVPARITFVETLTDLVLAQLPSLWKLWISYVNGSLFSETGDKSDQVEKAKKNARLRQHDFKKMLGEVLALQVKLLRGGAAPPPGRDVGGAKPWDGWRGARELPGRWLPQLVTTLRNCVESLTALDLPSDMLQGLHDFILDLRVYAVITVLQQTAHEVKGLVAKEDWTMDNRGVTSLPGLFEQHVQHSLKLLDDVVTCKGGETSVFALEANTTRVSGLFIEIIKVLLSCLEELATRSHTEADSGHFAADILSLELHGLMKDRATPTPEQRLLIVLSTCRYLSHHGLHSLGQLMERHDLPAVASVLQFGQRAVAELDEKLFDEFLEQKADPIVGALEPGMYAGYFDWNECLSPTGVRNYIKETLMHITAVHAEAFSVSKELVPRVVSSLVEAVAEEIARLMQCVASFSAHGALQARLEVSALRDAVDSFQTPSSRQSFSQALAQLHQVPSGTEKKLLEDLMNRFKSTMKLQLTCFNA